MYLIKHVKLNETHYHEVAIEGYCTMERGQHSFDELLKAGSWTIDVPEDFHKDIIAFYGYLSSDHEAGEVMPVMRGETVYLVNEKGQTVSTLRMKF